MHDRNFHFWPGRDSNTQPFDRQFSVLPLRYHRSDDVKSNGNVVHLGSVSAIARAAAVLFY